jgi:hypothetical protein
VFAITEYDVIPKLAVDANELAVPPFIYEYPLAPSK